MAVTRHVPPTVPTVLTIAGSDSSGGAGIQADLKAISATGGYGASVIVALTAQNTRGVTAATEVGLDLIRAQIDAVFDDLRVAAVKTGMLASRGVIETVAEGLRRHRPPAYVLDPVMVSKTGFPLLAPDAADALLAALVPLATVVTPNVHEAGVLAGLDVATPEDAAEAGRRLLARGAAAVLVKGGHLRTRAATDVLVTPNGVCEFPGELLDARHTHGTGCTYSAAIATFLARGLALPAAIGAAKVYVTEAIRGGLGVGQGVGPTDHFFFLRDGDSQGWARRLAEPRTLAQPSLAGGPGSGRSRPSGHAAVGRLHVITDETIQGRFSHVELARLAAAGGADVVQFREKRPWPTRRLVETARGMAEAVAPYACRLVVDDRVDVAIAAGIDAVHLGPDDLDPAIARRLLVAGARVGGTANDLETARRVAALPVDYLGVGPVFGTRSKASPAPTLGLDGLRAIVQAVDKPVVAIGNLTAERVADVLRTGAYGVALLSAVVVTADPEAATRAVRTAIDREVDR